MACYAGMVSSTRVTTTSGLVGAVRTLLLRRDLLSCVLISEAQYVVQYCTVGRRHLTDWQVEAAPYSS
jgi:hypothetical protein